jgi:GH24 family phage-related lysozyme (muramidase)
MGVWDWINDLFDWDWNDGTTGTAANSVVVANTASVVTLPPSGSNAPTTFPPVQEYLVLAEKVVAGHEGMVLHIYKDNDGSDTIGFGQHISSLRMPQQLVLVDAYGAGWRGIIYRNGISPTVAYSLLEAALKILDGELKAALDFYPTLSGNRKVAFLDLTYNLGLGHHGGKSGLLSFPTFLKYCREGRWDMAVIDLNGTAYAHQLPSREKNNAKLLTDG